MCIFKRSKREIKCNFCGEVIDDKDLEKVFGGQDIETGNVVDQKLECPKCHMVFTGPIEEIRSWYDKHVDDCDV